MKFRTLFFTLLIFSLILSGCGYRIQTKKDLPFESIAIGEIKNLTYEPRLQDRLMQSLAEVLMSYGFYLSNDAKYRIDGDITRFSLRVLSEISLTASEYEVDIAGTFTVTNRETGKTYPVKILRPFSTHFTTKDKLVEVLSQKESYTKRALNELSQEIARYIIYDLPEKQGQ